jgi:hypothetical protein
MPLTILDIAKAKGLKEDDRGISMSAVEDLGLPFMGGCQVCKASISCDHAYPSRSGYLRCKDDIGNDGYENVADFDNDNP